MTRTVDPNVFQSCHLHDYNWGMTFTMHFGTVNSSSSEFPTRQSHPTSRYSCFVVVCECVMQKSKGILLQFAN